MVAWLPFPDWSSQMEPDAPASAISHSLSPLVVSTSPIPAAGGVNMRVSSAHAVPAEFVADTRVTSMPGADNPAAADPAEEWGAAEHLAMASNFVLPLELWPLVIEYVARGRAGEIFCFANEETCSPAGGHFHRVCSACAADCGDFYRACLLYHSYAADAGLG